MAAEGNEDSDDYDLYHVDFTTASEWEVFIARIEEIFQQWKLHTVQTNYSREKIINGTWVTLTEKINFADFEFLMTRHFLKPSHTDTESNEEAKKNEFPLAFNEMMNIENDFIPVNTNHDGDLTNPHVLVRWYGLKHFVVLTPVENHLESESKLKVLLSSFTIALTNIGCQVPMFVRFLEPWQNFYVGICEGPDLRAEYEMVHLKKIPSNCKHLSGLLSLFKSKIHETNELIESVTIAARFAYMIQDWSNFAWSHVPPDIELCSGGTGWSELGCLPFGAICEPISSLTLFTYWPEVLETMAIDTECFTDYNPLSAPIWSVSIKKAENPVCLLTDYFTEFSLFCTINKTTEELLGEFAKKDVNEMLQSFSLLTESRIPTISTLFTQYASRKKSIEGPIDSKTLMPIMYYLFPDVEKNSEYPYPDEKDIDKGSAQRMKTCLKDSLVWRLALVMAHAMYMMGGAKAATHIWHEFSQEIRFRWNSGHMIPGILPGFPDPKSCLLHQKLQMINCCIERKIKRDEAVVKQFKESDESEDEFFDCDDTVEEDKQPQLPAPIGRLHQHGPLKLIKTGQPLYVPITQGATPKTEDQLEEDAQVLIRLGADAEGSQLRAKILSASLLSDMESFKAANPGSVIEDFIRWYSPRDWIETEDESGEKQGRLSDRMIIPGNTWLEVWETARPVPALRQKRLFDDTREAEKALHFIESQSPASSGMLVIPVLAHQCINKLQEESEGIEIDNVKNAIQQAIKRVEAITRHAPVDIRRYQELCMEIGIIETIISQVKSLESKLGEEESIKELIWRLVGDEEITLADSHSGLIASKLKHLFAEVQKVVQMSGDSDAVGNGAPSDYTPTSSSFPQATEREFILRCLAPRPHKHSRPSPQRLHVRISKEDITMASAFTQDKLFF